MNIDIKISDTLKHPSAFLPIAMSFTALAVVLVHVTMYGVTHEVDEGAAAHIWQLLMAGQVPIIAFFMFRWLSQAPVAVFLTLGLQVGAAVAAIAPVYFLHL